MSYATISSADDDDVDADDDINDDDDVDNYAVNDVDADDADSWIDNVCLR